MRNKKRKAGGNNRLLVSLFLSGHALGLAPTGIQFHTLAAEFDGFVSAYTNIILFLCLQLAHTLRGGAVLADGNGLVVFLKFLVCAVLHLITCGLGFLLFPSDLKAFLSGSNLRYAGALLRYAGALGVNAISQGLAAFVVLLKGNLNRVFAHIFHALGIRHIVVHTAL